MRLACCDKIYGGTLSKFSAPTLLCQCAPSKSYTLPTCHSMSRFRIIDQHCALRDLYGTTPSASLRSIANFQTIKTYDHLASGRTTQLHENVLIKDYVHGGCPPSSVPECHEPDDKVVRANNVMTPRSHSLVPLRLWGPRSLHVQARIVARAYARCLVVNLSSSCFSASFRVQHGPASCLLPVLILMWSEDGGQKLPHCSMELPLRNMPGFC